MNVHCFTQKSHNCIQNDITIITQIWLKCKSYIFHIKTSQLKEKNIIYIEVICIFFVSFLHFEAYGCFIDMLFYEFHMDSIEIS